jgi:hypothetical protein
MRIALIVSFVALGLATAAVAEAASPAQGQPTGGQVAQAPAGCPGNLLVNPNFDGPSRKTEAEGTSLSSAVSNGWSPWLLRGDARNNREPEYKVEQVAIGGDPYRTRSGGQSMKWFTTWGTHTAGIYQRVPVRPGSTLDFSIYSMIYSGEGDGWNAEKNSFLSDPAQPGNYRVSVGIDPTGAVPAGVGAAPPETVLWAPASMTPDQWVRLATQAKAQGPFVTVYTKGQPEWAVKHNDSWWDDACLRVVGAPPAKAIKKTTTVKPAPARTRP